MVVCILRSALYEHVVLLLESIVYHCFNSPFRCHTRQSLGVEGPRREKPVAGKAHQRLTLTRLRTCFTQL